MLLTNFSLCWVLIFDEILHSMELIIIASFGAIETLYIWGSFKNISKSKKIVKKKPIL